MDLVAAGLRALIRRSVRRELRGVWLRGGLPQGGAVLAPNHHSWWDGYVLGEVSWSCGQRINVLMDEVQLARFPFFRSLGVLGAGELRPALRRAGSEWLWVFPEGHLNAPGRLGPLRPGAEWLARAANVPLVPVALRVVLRGQEHPEAYLRIGRFTGDLAGDLAGVLAALDADLAADDPEAPLPGYLRLTRGAASASEKAARAGWALGRLLDAWERM